jgi:hypothetical protein
MLPRASVQSIRHASHVLRFSIVSKNRSRATKPLCGLNRLCFSVAISSHRRWSLSPCMVYLLLCDVIFWNCLPCFVLAPLQSTFAFLPCGFLPSFLVGFVPFFLCLKGLVCPNCLLSWAAVGHSAPSIKARWLIVHSSLISCC